MKTRRAGPRHAARTGSEQNGAAAATRAPQTAGRWFRKAREALDAFNPDLVLIWGDDQYENFREDGVPSFCVFAVDGDRLAAVCARRRGRAGQCLGRGRATPWSTRPAIRPPRHFWRRT
jgi:hypothetical protein